MKAFLKFGLLSLAVVFIFALVALLALDRVSHSKLDAATSAWRGHPAYADIATWRYDDVPETDNAAPLWTAAAAGWATANETGERPALDTLLDHLGQSTPAAATAVDRVVEQERARIDNAYMAASRTGVRWRIDYPRFQDPEQTDRLGDLRHLGVLLAADAESALRHGDLNLATQSIDAILDLAEDLRSPPSVISHLVAVTVTAHALRSLKTPAARPLIRPGYPLRDRIASLNFRNPLGVGAVGEVGVGLAMLDAQPQLRGEDARWPLSIWARLDRAWYMREMLLEADRITHPYPEAVAKRRDVEIPRGYIRSRVLLASFGSAARTTAEIEAARDLLLLATAEPPATEPLPPDPITGSAWKRSEPTKNHEAVLWSVIAEAPSLSPDLRRLLVWPHRPDKLPPELQAFADDLRPAGKVP